MPLTPIDVQQKTFGTALRGYDLDEVDDFLDEIVTSLKDSEQRLRDALGNDRDAALDLLQETYVTAFERLDSYRGQGSLPGWLTRSTTPWPPWPPIPRWC
mgnify:CR=1 FL=1